MFRIVFTLAMAPLLAAQNAKPRVFYFPKPVQSRPYVSPMKPVHRLADIKAKHKGKQNWSEPVIADSNTRAASRWASSARKA